MEEPVGLTGVQPVPAVLTEADIRRNGSNLTAEAKLKVGMKPVRGMVGCLTCEGADRRVRTVGPAGRNSRRRRGTIVERRWAAWDGSRRIGDDREENGSTHGAGCND